MISVRYAKAIAVKLIEYLPEEQSMKQRERPQTPDEPHLKHIRTLKLEIF